MFAYIKGVVEELGAAWAVLDVSGVGFEVSASGNTLKGLKRGERAKLLIHFHMTQDGLTLYGFATGPEREMFRRLIGVTRIGPKAALSVLSFLSVPEIALAIATDTPAAFDKVPGIGRKTAARLILELKEKIAGEAFASLPETLPESGATARGEAIAALVSLGYDGVTASRAVAGLAGEESTTEQLLAAALRSLAKQ